MANNRKGTNGRRSAALGRGWNGMKNGNRGRTAELYLPGTKTMNRQRKLMTRHITGQPEGKYEPEEKDVETQVS